MKPYSQVSLIVFSIAIFPYHFPQALGEARNSPGPTLAEPLVCGREFTVALLDDMTLPTIEIVTPEPVFSYDAKYHSSLTEYLFDFRLADLHRHEIHQAALGAARALDTWGLARVDVMLSHDGRAWVLEVNTVPGMTLRSLAPLAAARAGIDMPELCELLVRRCLAAAGVS